jgi:hypothetical protein
MNLIQCIAVLTIIVGLVFSLYFGLTINAVNRKRNLKICYSITAAQILISHLSSYFSSYN